MKSDGCSALMILQPGCYFLILNVLRLGCCTFQAGYPGVTAMWSGTLGFLLHYWQAARPTGMGLRTFFETISINPVDSGLIAPMRFSIVLIGSVFLASFYYLVRRLFNRKVALVATLLLTLSPFHIALSRLIHQDVLTTAFMVLSLLAMIGYWIQGWRWYWLLVSGVFAGMGFLTKSVSWFMMPYAAILGIIALIYRWKSHKWSRWFSLRQLIGEGALWGGAAALTFVVVNPAMLVFPAEFLKSVYEVNTQLASDGHLHFFLDRVTYDPGPFFYPVGWFLRASPLEVVGMIVWPVMLWQFSRGKMFSSLSWHRMKPRVLVGLGLFLFLFLLFETVPSKKMVRYFLPAFAIIDIFAAMGLIWLINGIIGLLGTKFVRPWSGSVLVGIILLLQGWFVFDHYPYYFTYFNPLFGGTSNAAQLITVGWGEGLDQAAAYLNSLPNAEEIEVVSWYGDAFAPFFQGKTVKIPDSDYILLYQNQIQRNQPATETLRYFLKHRVPEFTVNLHGVDYVLVYKHPAVRRGVWEVSGLPGKGFLLGVSQAEINSELKDIGSPSLFLYWLNLGLTSTERWWVALQSPNGAIEKWQKCRLRRDFVPEQADLNAILESKCPLTEELSSGVFHLRVGIGTDSDNVFPVNFPAGEFAIAVKNDGRAYLVPPND